MTFARIKLLLLLTKSTTCRPPRVLFQMLDPLAFIQLLRNIRRSDDVRNSHNFWTSVYSFSYGWSRATSFDHRRVPQEVVTWQDHRDQGRNRRMVLWGSSGLRYRSRFARENVSEAVEGIKFGGLW